ncbi:MAG: sucrose synthase (sucrose-UDP glucosyltransferase), partial [Herbiconiux sp.]|nr:sucrose synthase (sucrose-UDP glucosyltransferase) [Herbiconiux sp.]
MGIQTALDSVRDAASIVEALRGADVLAFEASREGGARTVRILNAALDADDGVVALASVHALAQVFDDQADAALSRLLSHPRGYLREHAAWVLGARLPRFDTLGRLIGLVLEGGFAGMLAQRSLEQWSAAAPEHVAVAVEAALLGVRQPDARARLVETLGLVHSRIATRAIMAVAADEAEEYVVRAAAVAALGDATSGRGHAGAAPREAEPGILNLLTRLAEGEGGLARVAELALLDLRAPAVAEQPVAGPR